MVVIDGLMDNTQTTKDYLLIMYLTLENITFFYTLNGGRKNTIIKSIFLCIVMNSYKAFKGLSTIVSKR